MAQPSRHGSHRVLSDSDDDASSGAEVHDSEDNSEDAEPDSFLDVEAEEEHEPAGTPFPNDDGPFQAFHPFVRLPPELRRRVWEIFCPDLVSETPRVLNFCTSYEVSSSSRRVHYPLVCGMYLESQTEAARHLLAVNKESRYIGLTAFPDAIRIAGGTSMIRFNREKDVVQLDERHRIMSVQNCDWSCLAEVINVALPMHSVWVGDLEEISTFLCHLKSLRHLFFFTEDREFDVSDLHWCTSDFVYKYRTQTREIEPGLGEDLDYLTCWPDPSRHRELTNMIPIHLTCLFEEICDFIHSKFGGGPYPMVIFDRSSRFSDRYALLRKEHERRSDESAGDLTESSYESDEYESEGIDDREIISVEDSSEDEAIPDPISPGNLASGRADDARFSSVEPDSSEVASNHDPGPSSRGRKRRILSDSDDESIDEKPRAKRVRASIVLLDSESEAENDAAAANSEESDRVGGSSGTLEHSDSPDKDEVPPIRLSLAERLRIHREQNPIPVSDDRDPSEEENESREATSEDAEDEDDDGDEHGLIDDIADESDDEDDTDGKEEDY